MPMIETNMPETLARARRQIGNIANAKDADAVAFWWAWATGYVTALAYEKLIDEDTKRVLDAEADRARDGWTARTVTH